MKRLLPSGLMFLTGVAGIAATAAQIEPEVTKVSFKLDLRERILRNFFKDKNCPAQNYAEVFVAEADAHHLDWRLLPSLALVESGGGKNSKGNNLFGWANGGQTFKTIADAIHTVAVSLAQGRAYRDKDTAGKLATYNKGAEYPNKVMRVMRQISPKPEIMAAD